ncbi:MAG: Nif3-like dinuclear metal center hexameric protein, partial [Defluviitaleaceae bacterium]|nr:Nif3-like dinuclear metal center hexameric protein [Defluviitaleaceae bacterium]
MLAIDLYNQLERDFVKPEMAEPGWPMGIMHDFAERINKVYTAVFPSDVVLNKILANGTQDAMLFLHHAEYWDLSKDPDVAFYSPNEDLLEKLKQRNISLFCYHVPLDNFGEYSTSSTLANALGITIEKPFSEYHGAIVAVIGSTNFDNISSLNAKCAEAAGHKTHLYQYGGAEIKNGR